MIQNVFVHVRGVEELRQCTVHCLFQARIKEEGCSRPVTANVKHYHIP